MLSIQGLVRVIIGLLVFFAIVGLLHFIIGVVPIPAPFKQWTFSALYVLSALALIGMLLDFAGFPIIKRNPPA